MNVYALFPLVATIAYIPLLVTAASSRPWNRRHTLFILFVVPGRIPSRHPGPSPINQRLDDYGTQETKPES